VLKNKQTKKQFKLFSDAAFSVIKNYENSPSIALNPILHVTRHFGPFVKLTNDFSKTSICSSVVSFLRFSVRFSQAFYQVVAGTERSSVYHETSNKRQFDVVIFSHADRKEYLAEKEDFYFGRLGLDLTEVGLSVCYIYTNKNKIDFDDTLSSIVNSLTIPRWILRNRLSRKEEFRLFLSALRVSITQTLSILAGKKSDFSSILLFLASRSYEVIPLLRLVNQIKNFCTICRPKFILYTYEGHAWESAAAYAAKTGNTDIKCIGYQHSAIFPLQYSLRREKPNIFRPDYIFCSGSRALRYLRLCFGTQSKITLVNSGSIRKTLQSKTLEPHENTVSQRYVDLLGLIGGEREEYELLIAFLCDFSLIYSNLSIRLRLNPYTQERATYFFSQSRRGSNISLSVSNLNLGHDLSTAHNVCYRDSTAVVSAIAFGCHPIFLALGNALSVNPLYLLQSIPCTTVSSFEGLSSALKNACRAENFDSTLELQKLWGPYSFSNVRNVFTAKTFLESPVLDYSDLDTG